MRYHRDGGNEGGKSGGDLGYGAADGHTYGSMAEARAHGGFTGTRSAGDVGPASGAGGANEAMDAMNGSSPF